MSQRKEQEQLSLFWFMRTMLRLNRVQQVFDNAGGLVELPGMHSRIFGGFDERSESVERVYKHPETRRSLIASPECPEGYVGSTDM